MSKSYDLKLKSIVLKGTMLDRRKKLTEEDKQNILDLYHKERLPKREIARRYEGICSRRLIIFVIHPERLHAMQEKHRKEEHWKTFYNREKLTKAKRDWANYKYKLYKNK